MLQRINAWLRNRRKRILRIALFVLAATACCAGAVLLYVGRDYYVLWPVSYPKDPDTAAMDESELSTHVHFLAQPALRGRRPFSMGSRIARGYIADRFRACHLKPWGDAPDFKQPFNLGTNIVGVLPGSDPDAAHELILLTAHYDHLGGGRLGACDNASGVAALLEIAEALAHSNPRPRRSVAFAVFDGEELGLLGAYTFTLRDDVQRARIRVAINLDMLGRHFLDLLDNSVIVAGTEFLPQTREALLAEAQTQRLRIYPAGLDLAGARGDHVAFLNLPRSGDAATLGPPAVLFFSSGTFEDYHEKGDRAERLDYPLLTRSTRLVERTVRRFADAESVEPRTPGKSPDAAELALFRAVGGELLRRGDDLSLTAEHRAACEAWLAKADACAANSAYSSEERYDLICGLSTLGPTVRNLLAKAIGGGDSELADDELKDIAGAAEMWTRYGPVFDEGYRRFVSRLAKHDAMTLMLRGLPEKQWPDDYFERTCFAAEDITVEDLGNGQLRLSLLAPNASVFAYALSFGRSGLFLNLNGSPIEWKGTREDLIDRCLLFWLTSRPIEAHERWLLDHPPANVTRKDIEQLMEHNHDPERIAAIDEGCALLLRTVTGEDHGSTFEDCLRWRLQELDLPDLDAWLTGLLKSANPSLVFPAVGTLNAMDPGGRWSERIRVTCLPILDNPEALPDSRARALQQAAMYGGKEGLQHVVHYLSDQTVVTPPPDPLDDESSPLRRHPLVRYGQEVDYGQEDDNETEESSGTGEKPPVTLGDIALFTLQKVTELDLGHDPNPWFAAIEDGSALPEDSCGCYRTHPILETRGPFEWHSSQ